MTKININEERNFENRKIYDDKIRKNQNKYYWAVQIPIKKHNKSLYEKIKRKNILEIGCSTGKDAKYYVNYCSFFFGIDISDEAIKKATSLNLKNSEFLCTDGHIIPKKDKEFDCVIVNSLLHHLDLEKALKEIHRVLKPKGLLIFREPLGINPFFKIYRKFTSNARTSTERPLTIEDIKKIKKYFIFIDVQWFGFLSIFSAFIRVNFLREFLTFFDYLLSKTLIKIFFWQISGFAEKK